jgi:hypothetical protein
MTLNSWFMKQLYTLFACLPFLSFAQQHWQVGSYLTLDVPNHAIMPKMSSNFGIGFQTAYKPIPRVPVMLEFKASTGLYSSRTMQQTYVFDSTSSTTTDVTYGSHMNRLNFGTKVFLTHEYRAIRPFITPQIGYAFMKTKIVIADPADEDDCKALDRRTTQRYSGFTYGAEAGVEISMDKLFKNVSSENKHRLYASVTFMNSFNTFEYVNVKHMQDHDHAAMTGGGGSPAVSGDDREVTTQFINVSTNQIHEHKIAELYRTNLQFWGLNIGYTFNF